MKITGHDAIAFAEYTNATLSKYNDPIDDAREGLTPDEARKVAAEDPSLIYIAVDWTEGDGSGHDGYNVADYFDDGRYLGVDMRGIGLRAAQQDFPVSATSTR